MLHLTSFGSSHQRSAFSNQRLPNLEPSLIEVAMSSSVAVFCFRRLDTSRFALHLLEATLVLAARFL